MVAHQSIRGGESFVSFRFNRSVFAVVAALVVFAVVASGCGSEGAGDRHAFFEPDDSPIRIDTTYGTDGLLDTNSLGTIKGFDSQGRAYLTKQVYIRDSSSYELRISRISVAGILDETFGDGGIVAIADLVDQVYGTNRQGYSNSLDGFVDNEDRFVLRSQIYNPGAVGGAYSEYILRLDSEGNLDAEIDGDGILATGGTKRCPGEFQPSPDGQYYMLVVGSSYGWACPYTECCPSSTSYARFDSTTGLRDSDLGWVTLDGDPGNMMRPSRTPEGRTGFVVVSGSDDGVTLRRYNLDGTVDNSLGQAGVMTDRPTDAPTHVVNDVLVDPIGQIVVVGYGQGYDNAHQIGFVSRYKRNGWPDTDFGPNDTHVLTISGGVPYGSDPVSTIGVRWEAKEVAANSSGDLAVVATRERFLEGDALTDEYLESLSLAEKCGIASQQHLELIGDDLMRFMIHEILHFVHDDSILSFLALIPQLRFEAEDEEADEETIDLWLLEEQFEDQNRIVRDCTSDPDGVEDPESLGTVLFEFLKEVRDFDEDEFREAIREDFFHVPFIELHMLSNDILPLVIRDSQEMGILTIDEDVNALYDYETLFPSDRYPLVDSARQNGGVGNMHATVAALGMDLSGKVLVQTRLPSDDIPNGLVRLERGLESTQEATFASSPACGDTNETADHIFWNIDTNLPYGEFAWRLETGAGLADSSFLADGAQTAHTHGPIQPVPWTGEFRIHGFDRRSSTETDPSGGNLIGSSEWFDPASNACAMAQIVTVESADSTGVQEAGGTDSFTVRLNSSILSSVTLDVSSSDAAELTVTPEQLIFDPGTEFTEQTVTVTGVDDGELDGDDAQLVSVIPAANSFAVYAGLTGAATIPVGIIDDEQQAADAAALQAAVDQAAAAEAAAQAALAQAAADQDAAAQAVAAQAVAQAAADQAAAEAAQALAQAAADQDAAAQAVAAQAVVQAAADQAAAAQEAAVQAAVEQALAEAAAAEAAAAEAAAAEAAAAEAAAGVVSTGYTAEDFASVASAAEFMELTISEFQATGVYIIDFLSQLGEGGYDSVTPLADPPDVSGPESISFTWDDEGQEVLDRVSAGYQVTPAEAQKFGAFLYTFLVGLSRG